MITRVVFVLLWIVTVGLLHLFGNNIGTFVVLAISVVVPVLAGALLACVKARAVFFTPQTCEKGGSALCNIMAAGWVAKLCKISAIVEWKNLFTYESGIITTVLGEFAIPAPHCGVLHVRVNKLKVADPFGIFIRELKYETDGYIFIPPTGCDVTLPILNVAPNQDSSIYSTTRPGHDVSETYAIREYVPGDPIRSIHWKLTEKLDKVMVREFGLPISNSVVVWLDAGQSAQPSKWDAAGERLYAMILALLEAGIRVGVGWYAEGDRAVEMGVASQDDTLTAVQLCFTNARHGVLSPPQQSTAFEHVIIVAPGGEQQ